MSVKRSVERVIVIADGQVFESFASGLMSCEIVSDGVRTEGDVGYEWKTTGRRLAPDWVFRGGCGDRLILVTVEEVRNRDWDRKRAKLTRG